MLDESGQFPVVISQALTDAAPLCLEVVFACSFSFFFSIHPSIHPSILLSFIVTSPAGNRLPRFLSDASGRRALRVQREGQGRDQ